MTSNVLAFHPAPRRPFRFTSADRQALLALAFVPGLEVKIWPCSDGEWATVVDKGQPISSSRLMLVEKHQGSFRLMDLDKTIDLCPSLLDAIVAVRAIVAERRAHAGRLESVAVAERWLWKKITP